MFVRVFPSGPLSTNAILIACKKTKQAAVIDPSQGSRSPILKEAEKEGLSIKKILLTHSHWDHFADLHALKEETGALVFVHPLDAPNVIKPGSDKLPLFIPIQATQIDGSLEEGQTIEIGHLKASVIHTPGHSPGSVCFYFAEQHVLLSGDTLFKGCIGRIDLSTGQPDLMWKSLKKLENLPKETRVISGHGPETLLGHETWLSRAKETFS